MRIVNGITAAVVIGVEASQEGVRPPVRHAAADATAFADALGGIGVRPDRRVLLVDGTATKTTIESRLRTFAATLTTDDTLALYFAGHAFAAREANYLVTHDTQPDDLVATTIPLRTVADVIERSPCGRAVLFVDPHRLPDAPGDFDFDALKGVCGERLIAIVSRGREEASHAADVLKHGVWAHLLLEAFGGKAAAAHDARYRITPRSLERYLAEELPRILRNVLDEPAEQTPMLFGPPATTWVLADLSPVFRARRDAAGLAGQHLERVSLRSETRTRVKDLAGFQKSHHVPDRVRPATLRFAAAAARDDLQADLDAVYAAVREHLHYRRKDVTLTPPTEGGGALRTPDFDYLVAVSLADDDPTVAVFRREVTHLRSADVLRRPAFQAAFGAAFQILSFDYAGPLDVEGLVDRLEDDPAPGVRVRCGADATWCEMDLAGFPATVRVERNRLEITGHRADGSNTLWAAFEAFRQVFNRARAPQALPPAGR
jgi:hypothetical protein